MKVFDDAMEDELHMYTEHGITKEDAAVMAHEAEQEKMHDEEMELKHLVNDI